MADVQTISSGLRNGHDDQLTGLRAELAWLRAEVARLAALVTLPPPTQSIDPVAESPRETPHAPCTSPDATRGRLVPDQAPTSRRGLLRRLGATAAAAAGAALALGAGRPDRAAADAAVTAVGSSTDDYGVYASPNNSGARPALPGGDYGVVGLSTSTANIGPLGFFDTGVFGGGNVDPGVIGASGSNHGVFGQAGSVMPPLPGPKAGVTGASVAAIGTQGSSSNNHGVLGRTIAPAGTIANGLLAGGAVGRATGTVALYGYADGGPNPNAPPYGAIGQCEGGFGFWGFSNAPPGAIARPGGGAFTALSGVLGTSPNNVGVYAISTGSYALVADGNGPATVGALIRGNGGAQAAVFVGNVQVQGNLDVTGNVTAPPPARASASRTAAGALRGIESPEALVEAVGQGQLVAGRAEVRLDPAFAALLLDARYHVVLTEYDDHSALYVTRRTAQGFEVRAKDSPTAASAFSYRVVGRRRDAEAARAAAAEPLHTPAIPAGQGVPTLPTVREPEGPPRERKRG